jgi:hypothetical protein
MHYAFHMHLNNEKVSVSQAALDLVDIHLSGVFLQADTTFTFGVDLKEAIMDVMADGMRISIFPKRVNEPSNDNTKIRLTNGLAVEVAISDPKKAGEYTETLSKAMEYLNENGSRPILSSKVFLPFGKSVAIDNTITFRKLIRMQNIYLGHIKHVEMHNLCHIDKDISLGYDTTWELISSIIHQMLMDATTIEQRKSQQHVKFGAYAKCMVKKFCSSNPNEATDEFDYAPSRPEKRWINLSFAAAVTTPVNRSEYA